MLHFLLLILLIYRGRFRSLFESWLNTIVWLCLLSIIKTHILNNQPASSIIVNLLSIVSYFSLLNYIIAWRRRHRGLCSSLQFIDLLLHDLNRVLMILLLDLRHEFIRFSQLSISVQTSCPFLQWLALHLVFTLCTRWSS